MTDKEYAADCIDFLRELANRISDTQIKGVTKWTIQVDMEDADKLHEIATSLQVDTQEDTK